MPTYKEPMEILEPSLQLSLEIHINNILEIIVSKLEVNFLNRQG